MRWRRYQLRKEAVGVALRHPWIFRDHLSSAASVFRDGERLRLVDGHNRVVGHGLYEATGAIAIRMLRRGEATPDAAWLRGRLAAAVARRAELARHTDAIRLIHGESDDLPAVVVDRFADTLVVTSYTTGADPLARYTAAALAAGLVTVDSPPGAPSAAPPSSTSGAPPSSTSGAPPSSTSGAKAGSALGPAELRAIIGPARHVVLRPARLRQRPDDRDAAHHAGAAEADTPGASNIGTGTSTGTETSIGTETGVGTGTDLGTGTGAPARVLRGAPPDVAQITEYGLALAVDLATGQKTGTYLDLRGLRREVAAAPLTGARVLNLFAYSGMLGRAAEAAGATAIVQVDASARALAFARAHHVTDPDRHTFVVADVFDWLPAAAAEPTALFDLVIVDPPSMTSKAAQVPGVLVAYRKLYRAAAGLVRPGGRLVAACCTSRVERAVFHRTVRDALGPSFTLDRELGPEPDHPVGFPQADYLKIAWWARTT